MKIKYQVFLLILTLTVILTFCLTFVIYNYSKDFLLNQTYSHLESIGEAKAIRIKGMIENIHEMSNFLSKDAGIRDEVIAIEKGIKTGSELSSALSRYVIDILRFKTIYILNKEGIVIASSDMSLMNKNLSQTSVFKEGFKKPNVIHDFSLDTKNQLSLTASDLILTKDNFPIGLVVINLNAEEFLSLTNDYTGLGRTGETNLAFKRDNKTIYISPLKFDRDAALKKILPSDDSSYVMNIALTGKEGIFTDKKDYQNQKVIAFNKFIPETHWGMVTKIDREEAFSNLYLLQEVLFVVVIIFILIAFIISYLLGRYIAGPIEDLILTANDIRNGALETRIQINSDNELGMLAESFNSMTDRLVKKIDDLDKFAYIISHDLKAPVQSIKSLLSIIEEENKNILNEESILMVNMARQKSDQVESLITEVLKSAKDESKELELIDVSNLLKEIIENLKPDPDLQIYLPNNLPRIRYHRVSLIQIFQNLIGNSIKYMDKKDGEIKIEYQKLTGYHQFGIRDNGPGIDEKYHATIFEMFGKAHQRTDVDSSGIGLSIVKKIIEDNKGKIWLKSSSGQGSTFYFTIPEDLREIKFKGN